MKRRADGSWPGRLVLPVLRTLVELSDLNVLSVVFRSTTPSTLGARRKYQTKYGKEVEEALGLGDEDWHDVVMTGRDSNLPGVKELNLPNLSTNFQQTAPEELFRTPSTLRRLRIGCSSPPSVFSAPGQREACEKYEREVEAGERVQGFNFEVLALPYHSFYPRDFFPLTQPLASSTTPIIAHVEVTFRVINAQQDLPIIAQILTFLSPSLRRLALRIKHKAVENFDKSVFPALEACKALESLEIGGEFVDFAALAAPGKLPKLRRLVILSTGYDMDMWEFVDGLPHTIHGEPVSLTLCLPGPQASFDRWGGGILRLFAEAADRCGYQLKIEERLEEYAWMACEED